MDLPREVDSLLRTCFRAVLQVDREALARVALPHPDLDVVLSKPWPPEQRAELVRQVHDMQISLRDQQADRLYVHVYFRGQLQPIVVVKTAEGWRVDMRWWITAMRAPEPMHDVAREFLFAMLTGDQEQLEQLAVYKRGTEVLTRDPAPAGEAAQLAHVCQTMQLAEFGLGESFPNMVGETETVNAEHQAKGIRVLVGLFNGGEVPFLMQEVEGEWKVSPFHFIRAAAAVGRRTT